MNPWFLILAGLALVLVPMALSTYLLMPMPGSQYLDSLNIVYQLIRVQPILQITGALLACFGLYSLLRKNPTTKQKLLAGCAALLAIAAFTQISAMQAPNLFSEFDVVRFDRGTTTEIPGSSLVMGIAGPETAKAYPIRLMGYHHRLVDNLDGQTLWVTYCTMCRTGKIFSPIVNDEQLDFELVGANYFNSIYRDQQTGSIWYQANGKAVAGTLVGERLQEYHVDQVTLDTWLQSFPDSLVLQPDPTEDDGYQMFNFGNWDELRSDAESPSEFQWVVGVINNEEACAYRWANLSARRLVQSRVGGLPIAIHLAQDGVSYRVWNRRLNGAVIDLAISDDGSVVDAASQTTFGIDGIGVGGTLAGSKLTAVPAGVEFAHSFLRFSDGKYCGDAG